LISYSVMLPDEGVLGHFAQLGDLWDCHLLLPN